MNFLKLLFFGGFGLYGCGFCSIFVLLHLFTSMTADQLAKAGLPFAAQKITQWQLGLPMDTYTEVPLSSGNGLLVPTFGAGPVKPTGYVGPKSFRCGLPIEFGYLTSPFGPRDGHIHTGIDFGTYHLNQAVWASMGGEVIYAGWSEVGYGNLVVVENDGVLMYVGHLDTFGVQVGDIVTAGNVLGISGTTGNSSGIHVHLEFRRINENGTTTPFDPNFESVPGQTDLCDYYNYPYDEELDHDLHGIE